MSKLAIAAKIKARQTFEVPGKRERNLAYQCANFFGIRIVADTDKNTGRVTVKFVAP